MHEREAFIQILDEYGEKAGVRGLSLDGLRRFYTDGNSNLQQDFAAMQLRIVSSKFQPGKTIGWLTRKKLGLYRTFV